MRIRDRGSTLIGLTPGRILRDAHGLMWQLDDAPRWTGEQLRVRVRLLRCDGVWGDLPAEVLEPTPNRSTPWPG
jgi:hypothetical protein